MRSPSRQAQPPEKSIQSMTNRNTSPNIVCFHLVCQMQPPGLWRLRQPSLAFSRLEESKRGCIEVADCPSSTRKVKSSGFPADHRVGKRENCRILCICPLLPCRGSGFFCAQIVLLPAIHYRKEVYPKSLPAAWTRQGGS